MRLYKVEKLYTTILDSFSTYPRDKSILLEIDRSMQGGYNKSEVIAYIYELVGWLCLLCCTEKYDKNTKLAVAELLEMKFLQEYKGVQNGYNKI